MAAFLKKMRRNKIKTSDEPVSPLTLTESTVGHEDVGMHSSELVLSESADNQSPEHSPVTVSGSLFSGMVLTENARKQEADSSPYLQKRKLTDSDYLNKEESETNDDTSQLGFSFIKASQDVASNQSDTNTDNSGDNQSSFGFINEGSRQPCTDTGSQPSSELNGFSFITNVPKSIPVSSSNYNYMPDSNPVSPDDCSLSTTTTENVGALTDLTVPGSVKKQQHKVSRQIPPSSAKKKKHKAIRPGQGQERNEETYSDSLEIVQLPEHDTNERGDVQGRLYDTDRHRTEAEILVPGIGVQIEDTCTSAVIDSVADEKSDLKLSKIPSESALPYSETFVESSVLSVETSADTVESIADKDENSLPSSLSQSCHSSSVTEKLTDAPDALPTSNYTIELSATERLATYLEVSRSNSTKILSDYDSLHNQYGPLIEALLASLQSRILGRENVRNLKAREESALAEENYELAEELRRELETAETVEDNSLATAHVTVREWLNDCQTLLASEVTLLEQVKCQFAELEDEQTKKLSLSEEEFSLDQAKKKMDLQTMTDKVEKEKGHIALDREHLEKRQRLLHEEVSQRAAKFISSKKLLEEDKMEVDDKIHVLEEELQQLQQRRAELIGLIAVEDEKIGTVHIELSSVQEQLDKEKSSLRETEEDLQQQEVILEELQASYDRAGNEYEVNKCSVLSVIDKSKNSCLEITRKTEQLEKALLDSNKWTLDNIADYLQPSERLKRLIEQEKTKDNEMKTVTSKVLACQSELSAIHKHISDLESQLPKLHDSKKTAVAARQYREASKLAAEEKELVSKLELIKQQAKAVDSELSSQNDVLHDLNDELNKFREEKACLEKEEDIEHIHQLVSVLMEQRSRMSNLEAPVTLPMKFVIKQWCSVHELLIQDLCSKHSLNIQDYLTQNEFCDANQTGEFADPVDRLSPVAVSMEEKPVLHVEKEQTDNAEEVLRSKVMDVEARITKACEEEKYDIAAELDEELNSLKSKLAMLISTA